MKILVLVALILGLATGCSSRDEDAFLKEVKRNATASDWRTYDRSDFIMTGDIACGMMKDGKGIPNRVDSAVTGVAWLTVWFPAKEHLC